jgi:hypothetical protein
MSESSKDPPQDSSKTAPEWQPTSVKKLSRILVVVYTLEACLDVPAPTRNDNRLHQLEKASVKS